MLNDIIYMGAILIFGASAVALFWGGGILVSAPQVRKKEMDNIISSYKKGRWKLNEDGDWVHTMDATRIVKRDDPAWYNGEFYPKVTSKNMHKFPELKELLNTKEERK